MPHRYAIFFVSRDHPRVRVHAGLAIDRWVPHPGVLHLFPDVHCDATQSEQNRDDEKSPNELATLDSSTAFLYGGRHSRFEFKSANFTSFYERRILEGVGHCPPKEGPRSFLKGVEDLTAAATKL
jgi:hypothetical protein